MTINPQIHKSRKNILIEEFQKPYFLKLKNFLLEQKKAKKSIFPKSKDIFNAFNMTPFDKVKVVILGQDPYHGPGQAHGLAFSVPDSIKIPPSLRNIYKELFNSFPKKRPDLFQVKITNNKYSGNLTQRAQNGVLLLNTVLTVEKNKARSHRGKGRETFTDTVISKLSDKKSGLVFLLWGNDARNKKNLIDKSKHHILETTHPSPLSAHRGFLGSGCFKKTVDLLG